MTYGEMKSEVSRRLAEVSGRVFWSEADIATAIDAGYAEMSDQSEWNEEYFQVSLLNDRPYYDLRTVVGANVLSLRAAFDEQTNRWLIPTSVRQFDAHDRRWERVTGEPQRVFTRGLWWLGYWPRIQADSGLIKQYYTALPAPMTDDDDEPGFPEPFHYGCVNFALTDLWAQDAETDRALLEWAAYLKVEAGLERWVAERAGSAALHGFAGASA